MTLINPPVTRAEATAIVDFAFKGNSRLLGVVPLPGGQVNSTAMLVLDDGRRLVLRIAPDPAVTELGPSWLSPFGLRREAAIIAAATDLQELLPVTVASDFTGTVLPRDWVLQEMMPGVPLETLLPSLDDEAASTIWLEVGRFMRALHDHGQHPFGPLAWGPQFDSWLDLLRHDVAGLVADALRYHLPVDLFRRLEWAIERHADILSGVLPALIHSDLNPAHLFVTDDDEDGSLHLGGVIDLEYGRVADPLSEHLLASAICHPNESAAHVAILAGYGLEAPGTDQPIRIQVATALGASWDATLLAFQDRAPAPALENLKATLDRLDAI